MKIKSIHIENFGKLSDETIAFDDSLTSYMHENGWGKTTLAVFIKAIFYGMADKNPRSKEFSEREKYQPWGGGTYGGSITFVYNGKEYKVTRTFGARQKDDTFEVYDALLNKPCEALADSANGTLGDNIFKIDRDTFERSVFVTLDEDKRPESSTNISAKLNNLVENSNDLSNYDTADALLDDMIGELKKKKGGHGRINELEEKISEANEQLVDIDSKEQTVKLLQEKIAASRALLAKEKTQVAGLQKLFAASEKYTNKTNYDALKQQQSDTREAQKTLLAFFNGAVPSGVTVDDIAEKYKSYAQYETLLKNDPVTEADRVQQLSLEQSFGGHVPRAEQIAACQSDVEKNDKLIQEINKRKLTDAEELQLAEGEKKFAGKTISESVINSYLEAVEKSQNLGNKIAELNNAKNNEAAELAKLQQQKPKNPLRAIFFGVGAVCVLAGVALAVISVVLHKPLLVPGLVAGVAGIGLLIVGIVKKPAAQDFSLQTKQIAELENQIAQCASEKQSLEQSYKDFIAQTAPEAQTLSVTVALSNIKNSWTQYDALCVKKHEYETWIKAQPVQPEAYEQRIRLFIMQYAPNQSVEFSSDVLTSLRNRIDELSALSKKIVTYDQNKELLSSCEKKLQQSLAEYNCTKTAPYEKQLTELREKIQQHKLVSEQVASLENKIAEFEGKYNVAEFEHVEKPAFTSDEISEQLEEEQKKCDALTEQISDFQKKIDDFVSDTDMRQSVENDIDRWTAEKSEAEKRYAILTKTQQYLAEAKDSLAANYMSPMKKNFEKYVALLDDKLTFEINSDLDVSVNGCGTQHSSNFLSAGYKDLVNFCARMALVDSLFTNEKPPVILDDPFVNLDEEKLKKALALVKDMAGDKQIIYLACHESRSIDK
jgi:uncharacterized protein YhaN